MGDVDGKDVILVDDMTETAGTLVAAAELIKKNGARTVRAMVSHCMIQEIAYERFKKGVIDEVITTNSVPIDTRGLPITVLSIAPLLADAIRRIHGNNSVTDLFPIKGHWSRSVGLFFSVEEVNHLLSLVARVSVMVSHDTNTVFKEIGWATRETKTNGNVKSLGNFLIFIS